MTTRIEAPWTDIGEQATRELLREFTRQAGVAPAIELRPGVPYHHLKQASADLDPRDPPGPAWRIRQEFFSHPTSGRALASLLAQLGEPEPGSWIGRCFRLPRLLLEKLRGRAGRGSRC